MPLSCNLGTLTSWNPLGHSRPVTGLLYLYLFTEINVKVYTGIKIPTDNCKHKTHFCTKCLVELCELSYPLYTSNCVHLENIFLWRRFVSSEMLCCIDWSVVTSVLEDCSASLMKNEIFINITVRTPAHLFLWNLASSNIYLLQAVNKQYSVKVQIGYDYVTSWVYRKIVWINNIEFLNLWPIKPVSLHTFQWTLSSWQNDNEQ